MATVIRAMAGAAWTVLRAPWLLAAVTAATLVTVIPFGLVLGTRLDTALASQPPISRSAGDIDPEWWMEFRHHARGLEATFTPAVIGFAGPLDNLSALADRTPRPLVLALPVALYGLVWAFLWGGLLHRFARRGPISAAEFFRASSRHVGAFVLISIAASALTLLLYATVHQVLLGSLYRWLAASAASERDAFIWRLVLYAVFGSLLAGVAAVADYARVSMIKEQARSAREALVAGARFVRRHLGAVTLLYSISAVVFLALFALFGATEIYGGARVGGWRAVVIGQAYIVARLAIRLTTAAAEVRLVESLSGPGTQPASMAPE